MLHSSDITITVSIIENSTITIPNGSSFVFRIPQLDRCVSTVCSSITTVIANANGICIISYLFLSSFKICVSKYVTMHILKDIPITTISICYLFLKVYTTFFTVSS